MNRRVKTGQISGEFSSHVTSLTTGNVRYDDYAKGTFTGQVTKDTQTMTVFLKDTAGYYYQDQATPGHPRQGPYNDNGETRGPAAAVLSGQTYWRRAGSIFFSSGPGLHPFRDTALSPARKEGTPPSEKTGRGREYRPGEAVRPRIGTEPNRTT